MKRLSKEKAHILNKEYIQDLYEYEHQGDMISKSHDFVHSDEIQKQNSAEEFLSRSKYQREVCDEILEELDEERKAMTKDIDFPPICPHYHEAKSRICYWRDQFRQQLQTSY